MILVINTGSSSLRYKLFDEGKVVKADGIDRIRESGMLIHAQAWEKLYQGLSSHREDIKAVGHRIVHGGDKYRKPTVLTSAVLKNLGMYVPLAPLHMPPVLEMIETTMTVFANVPHIGIFDTAFFADLPEKAYMYGLPYELCKQEGIRRYGFHGISHSHALKRAQEELGLIRTQRTVSVHLGSGSSVAAINEGRCIDISMGFTPLEGLMMATRAGDVDAGILLFLLRKGMSIDEVSDILHNRSGLLGISGASADMRDLLFLAGFKVEDQGYTPPKNISKNEETIRLARLAIDMFTYRVAKYIGSLTVALGGLDALVFTGSVGAGSLEIRNLILGYLRFLGDYELLVVAPDEESEMHEQVQSVLASV